MKTRLLSLFAAIGALAAFGSACADEAAAETAGVESIVVTAKRLAAPAEADIVGSAPRAVSVTKPDITLKPEITVPKIEILVARAPEDRG